MEDLTTLRLQDFGVVPDSGQDSASLIRVAMLKVRETGTKRVTMEPGRYDFWPDRASEQFLFVSNNDEGLRRVAFQLNGLDGFELDCQGAGFIFHGMIVPFTLIGSSNVTVRNLFIDWHRPFHSEAEIVHVGKTDDQAMTPVDLKFSEEYPYTVTNHQLYFTDDTGLKKKINHSLEFDVDKRETALNVYDNWSHESYHVAKEVAPRTVRLTSDWSTIPTVGNVLAINHTGRDTPGFFVTDSKNIALIDVTMYHAGAMALIAQRTTNIKAERFNVIPNLKKNRYISATADATHFVNCAGLVELIDCEFAGQLDDATNIHGIYARISNILSETQIEIEIVHGQQLGVYITHPGDQLEFVNNENLLRYHVAGVASTEQINKRFILVTLDSQLPANAKVGDAVASLTWVADAHIRGCKSQNNRARGFLISTGGKVLIENNYFHIPGASILIAGDANYWFESGPVHDVTIRGNHFDNCNFGVWGRGVIDIYPEIPKEHRAGVHYHSNIKVEGNTFDVFDPRLVIGHNIDGFTFTGNTINPTTAYPAPEKAGKMFDLTDSDNVNIDVAERE